MGDWHHDDDDFLKLGADWPGYLGKNARRRSSSRSGVNTVFKTVFAAWFVMFVIWVSLLAGAIFMAWHFLGKYW